MAETFGNELEQFFTKLISKESLILAISSGTKLIADNCHNCLINIL